MKIKSTLLNNCERQLQLNSQVWDCSWRCWIHRLQAVFLDESIGCSQHQLLLNICFAGTSYSKLHPFYKSEVQLLLIFSNSHHCIFWLIFSNFHLLRLRSFDWTGFRRLLSQAVGVNSQTGTCPLTWMPWYFGRTDPELYI